MATESFQHFVPPLEVWNLYKMGDGQLSPLHRLAETVFAVCPNAAPVERYFSLLKRILTPARSRLTTRNLMNTAELNMHIMYGYESRGTLVERLQRRERHFVDVASATARLTTAPPPPSPAIDPSLQSSITPSHTAHGNPDTETSISTSPTEPETTDSELLDSTMQDIARTMITQAEEAEDNRDYEDLLPPAGHRDEPWRRRLEEVFNFSNPYWIDTMERLGLRVASVARL